MPLRRSQRLTRRHQSPPDVPHVPEGLVPYLPPEIMGLVATHLEKSDLKQTRLVNSVCNALVTPLLFDQVYVSPRTKDLEVFTAITSRPQLAASVKKIIYDVSTFYELSHREYFELMFKEIRSIFYPFRRRSTHFTHPRRLAQLVRATESSSSQSLFDKYGNDAMVRKGFARWEELEEDEHACITMFYPTLCLGMFQLSNLRSVKMDDDVWDRGNRQVGLLIEDAQPILPSELNFTGSPLSRKWGTFHPRPVKPNFLDGLDRDRHLQLIIRALSKTRRRISFFDTGTHAVEGLSPHFFSRYGMEDRFPHQMIYSLWYLETLELQITPRKLHDHLQPQSTSLGFLPNLLSKLSGLKRLALIFTSTENMDLRQRHLLRDYDEPCYSYKDVFPRNVAWPRLFQFYIAGLAISGPDLYRLAFHQMPNLGRLWLSHIDLLQWRWEGFLSMLRLKPRWEVLGLQGIFRHRGGQWWPCHPDDEGEEMEKLDEYLSYITYGGQHPGLPVGPHDSTWESIIPEWFT
ncbi:hypothetical protein G7Y79_00073g098250 [Physcia stellaris]|nr:hypothetical protein G7Y79_00073g098250 [Physcia stellaris]